MFKKKNYNNNCTKNIETVAKKKISIAIHDSMAEIKINKTSGLPVGSALDLQLKEFSNKLKLLKEIPFSIRESKNLLDTNVATNIKRRDKTYPNFFMDIPLPKYLTSAKPRRPRRPPTGKVIEEIQQPLGFVNKIIDFMKILIKKLLTKKTLAAFVVALVAILIIRYTWNAAKAKKKEKEKKILLKGGRSNKYNRTRYQPMVLPLRKKHFTKRIVLFVINKLFKPVFNFILFILKKVLLIIGIVIIISILLSICAIVLIIFLDCLIFVLKSLIYITKVFSIAFYYLPSLRLFIFSFFLFQLGKIIEKLYRRK